MAAAGAWVNGVPKHISALAQTSSQDLVITISTPMLMGFALGIVASLLVVAMVYATKGRTNSAHVRWRKPVFARASDSETCGSSDGAVGVRSFHFIGAETARSSVASTVHSLSDLPMEKNDSDDDMLVTMSGHRRERRKLFRGATDELKEKMLNMHGRQLEAQDNPEEVSLTPRDVLTDEEKHTQHGAEVSRSDSGPSMREWPSRFGPPPGKLCTIDSVGRFDSNMEASLSKQKKKLWEKAAAFAQQALPVAPDIDEDGGGSSTAKASEQQGDR